MDENNVILNRELSWLRFNTRVLAQANKDLPLLERLKFIAIYCTNLDEFYMIRVAGLKSLYAAGVSVEGTMSPLEQLREIRSYLKKEQENLENAYKSIVKGLDAAGLHIKNYEDLSDAEKARADVYFKNYIWPVIVPIAVDSTHPFPHLNNLSFGIAVKLADSKHPEINKFGMVRISHVLPRPTPPHIYTPFGAV